MDTIAIHPPFTHFAIAFPLMLLIIHLFYMINKKELDSLHLLLTFLSALAVVVATITGIIAHEPIETKLEEIKVFGYHQKLGLLLALYFVILAIVRIIMTKTKALNLVFTILLIIGVVLLFIQGKLGGSIVYENMITPWLK
jgi:Predicted membrane protein